jgi:hypothetical protein
LISDGLPENRAAVKLLPLCKTTLPPPAGRVSGEDYQPRTTRNTRTEQKWFFPVRVFGVVCGEHRFSRCPPGRHRIGRTFFNKYVSNLARDK